MDSSIDLKLILSRLKFRQVIELKLENMKYLKKSFDLNNSQVYEGLKGIVSYLTFQGAQIYDPGKVCYRSIEHFPYSALSDCATQLKR